MDDDTQNDQFCEEDIDQILQRRTQIVQIEQGVKGGTFSKVGTTGTTFKLSDPLLAQKVEVDFLHSGWSESFTVE